MARKSISGETPFRMPACSFAIEGSSSGYTLQQSVDYDWTEGADNSDAHFGNVDDEAIEANTICNVTDSPLGVTYRLKDNTDTVIIQF